MSDPLNMDVHAPERYDAVWPDGFKEKALAQAATIVTRDKAPKVADVIAKLREQLPAMLQHELVTGAWGMEFELALGIAMTLRDVVLENFIKSVTVTTDGAVTVVDHRTPEA